MGDIEREGSSSVPLMSPFRSGRSVSEGQIFHFGEVFDRKKSFELQERVESFVAPVGESQTFDTIPLVLLGTRRPAAIDPASSAIR